MKRLLRLAAALCCAAMLIPPIASDATSANTIWLRIKLQQAGSVNGLDPNHEYELDSYAQNGASFSGTMPLNGSSTILLSLTGRVISQAIVRLDGQGMNTAFQYSMCVEKSDSVSANASGAIQKLSFTCQKQSLFVQTTATPSPSPVPHVLTVAKPLMPLPSVKR